MVRVRVIVYQSELLGLGAFIIPNQPIGFEHKLQEFQVDLKDLEKSVGVIFTPKLDTHNVQNLCEINSCELMKREQFELDFPSYTYRLVQ
jgi:nuclease EXOG